MKKIVIGIVALFGSLGVSLNAQEFETRMVSDFDEVSVVGNILVELSQGDKHKVEIEADGVSMDKISTSVEARHLKIRLRPGIYKDADVVVRITYQDINHIRAHAAGEIEFLDVLKADNLEIDAGSAAKIDIPIEVKNLDIRVGEGSRVLLTGTAKYQKAKVGTGGLLLADDLNTNEAYIRVNTGGEAEIWVKDIIEAAVGTGGELTYRGNPDSESVKTSLGGSVRKI